MKTHTRRRGSFACTSALVLALLATYFASAAPASAKSSMPSCTKITTAMAQPLEKDPITGVKVTAIDGTQYLVKSKKVGDVCAFTTASTNSALGVTVISGPAAKRAWQSELLSLRGKKATVRGVGDQAVRERADADGGVASAAVAALKGTTYCSVDAEESAEESALEESIGGTGRIGDDAYAIIAAAEGTLCNRVFGSGNTTADLSGLESITPPSTTEGGLDGIPGT